MLEMWSINAARLNDLRQSNNQLMPGFEIKNDNNNPA